MCISVAFVSCNEKYNIPHDQRIEYDIPSGFPPMIYPVGSEPTTLRVLLGRILFYDKRLSANNQFSCGSCHSLSMAFTDGKVVPSGFSDLPGKRNVSTLTNVGFQPYYLFEGGAPTLETQALVPLHDTLEMGQNMMDAIDELNQDEYLRELSRLAFDRDSIDPWVVTRSLAIFQRTFISGDSYFDRYKRGQTDALSDAALRGMELFFSERTNCSSCHSGVFFTDFGFYNIGSGAAHDPGRFRLTHEPVDSGKFKTPTLRNVALTAPYMHDGTFNSLSDVLRYYNRGGNHSVNKDERIVPLGLSDKELDALKIFLECLTDWNFVQDKRLLPLER